MIHHDSEQLYYEALIPTDICIQSTVTYVCARIPIILDSSSAILAIQVAKWKAITLCRAREAEGREEL